MSGIVGIISKSGEIDLSRAEKALDLLQHRGPDGYQIERGTWGVLGANLLKVNSQSQSIIAKDEEAGVCLAIDGSILNIQDLRNSLTSKRALVKKENPTDVALKLYIQDGKLQDNRAVCAFGNERRNRT